ncbi:hypothetical protein Tco_1140728 [Tanacetum coccineum]
MISGRRKPPLTAGRRHRPPCRRRQKSFPASVPAETKSVSLRPIYPIIIITRLHAPSSPSTATSPPPLNSCHLPRVHVVLNHHDKGAFGSGSAPMVRLVRVNSSRVRLAVTRHHKGAFDSPQHHARMFVSVVPRQQKRGAGWFSKMAPQGCVGFGLSPRAAFGFKMAAKGAVGF